MQSTSLTSKVTPASVFIHQETGRARFRAEEQGSVWSPSPEPTWTAVQVILWRGGRKEDRKLHSSPWLFGIKAKTELRPDDSFWLKAVMKTLKGCDNWVQPGQRSDSLAKPILGEERAPGSCLHSEHMIQPWRRFSCALVICRYGFPARGKHGQAGRNLSWSFSEGYQNHWVNSMPMLEPAWQGTAERAPVLQHTLSKKDCWSLSALFAIPVD